MRWVIIIIVDIMSLGDYRNHAYRQRAHQVGLATREVSNREARQATHMAAGTGQFDANRYEPAKGTPRPG